jgi:hypothetical protein
MKVLEKEMEVYRANLAQLRHDHPNGGFVVIKGDQIFGVWNDRGDALSAAVKEFGYVSLLVKSLEDVGRKFNFSRDYNFA